MSDRAKHNDWRMSHRGALMLLTDAEAAFEAACKRMLNMDRGDPRLAQAEADVDHWAHIVSQRRAEVSEVQEAWRAAFKEPSHG